MDAVASLEISSLDCAKSLLKLSNKSVMVAACCSSFSADSNLCLRHSSSSVRPHSSPSLALTSVLVTSMISCFISLITVSASFACVAALALVSMQSCSSSVNFSISTLASSSSVSKAAELLRAVSAATLPSCSALSLALLQTSTESRAASSLRAISCASSFVSLSSLSASNFSVFETANCCLKFCRSSCASCNSCSSAARVWWDDEAGGSCKLSTKKQDNFKLLSDRGKMHRCTIAVGHCIHLQQHEYFPTLQRHGQAYLNFCYSDPLPEASANTKFSASFKGVGGAYTLTKKNSKIR